MKEKIRLFDCALVQIFQNSYDGVSIDRKKKSRKKIPLAVLTHLQSSPAYTSDVQSVVTLIISGRVFSGNY